jgi:hypothetical protein
LVFLSEQNMAGVWEQAPFVTAAWLEWFHGIEQGMGVKKLLNGVKGGSLGFLDHCGSQAYFVRVR